MDCVLWKHSTTNWRKKTGRSQCLSFSLSLSLSIDMGLILCLIWRWHFRRKLRLSPKGKPFSLLCTRLIIHLALLINLLGFLFSVSRCKSNAASKIVMRRVERENKDKCQLLHLRQDIGWWFHVVAIRSRILSVVVVAVSSIGDASGYPCQF